MLKSNMYVAFQTAIFKKLSDSSNVSNNCKGIYDYVPEDTKFPYIVIGDDDYDESNTKTSFGISIKTTINVWDGPKTMIPIKTLLHEINSALSSDLNLDGIDESAEFVKVLSTKVKRVTPDLVHGEITIEYLIEEE